MIHIIQQYDNTLVMSHLMRKPPANVTIDTFVKKSTFAIIWHQILK